MYRDRNEFAGVGAAAAVVAVVGVMIVGLLYVIQPPAPSDGSTTPRVFQTEPGR